MRLLEPYTIILFFSLTVFGIVKSINLLDFSKVSLYFQSQRLRDKVEFTDGDKKISIEPNENSLEVDFQLNYENQIIGRQRNSINLSNDKLEDI